LDELADVKPREVWLFHNAGSLGQLAPIVETDAQQLTDSLALNVTSPTVITARVLQHYQAATHKYRQ
jgi:short-subunit dehydrogenase